MILDVLLGAPTRSIEAKEGYRGVHWILFLSTFVHGGVVGEILECERHTDLTCAHACFFDERGALGGALRGTCLFDWRKSRYQLGVGGDGLAQVGAHGRMLPGIEAEYASDLIAMKWLYQWRDQKDDDGIPT